MNSIETIQEQIMKKKQTILKVQQEIEKYFDPETGRIMDVDNLELKKSRKTLLKNPKHNMKIKMNYKRKDCV